MVVVRDVWRVLQPNGGGMQYAVAVHLFTVRHHVCGDDWGGPLMKMNPTYYEHCWAPPESGCGLDCRAGGELILLFAVEEG